MDPGGPSSGEPRSLAVPSRLDALGPLRAEVVRIAREHGFSASAADDLGLCVHEAVSNAIVHGHREDPARLVRIDIRPDGDGLRVRVRNEGPGFDPAAVLATSADGDKPRGRGMRIIRSLTDEFGWRDEGREIEFLKRP